MARRRRAAQGAYRYRARTARTAFRPKRGPSPTSKAGRRQARSAAYRAGKLPKPGSKAASAIRDRFLPDTEEVRFLKRAARTEILALGVSTKRSEYADELKALAEREYRKRYNAQHRGRPRKAKKKPERIRVKAHWRRRPSR